MTDTLQPVPDARGRFGTFGGRYVPEVLIPALEELEAAWRQLRADEGFQAEFRSILADFVGRPTPLTYAARLSDQLGYRVWLKREDLSHTGAHKINNTIGQVLLAKRLGKRRIIAETGAGQHGVATATACALFGLPCVVYMGEEDTVRQAVNVERMKLLGAEVVPVTTGSMTLKDAINEALRDWAATVTDTHYVIGSVVGPHPFPAMVRDFQRVIGDEARAQFARRGGRRPRRGGRLRRRRVQRDRHVHRVRPRNGAPDRRRSRRRGRRPALPFAVGGEPRRAARRRGCTCSRTRTVRWLPTHSISAGSTTRASAPSTRG